MENPPSANRRQAWAQFSWRRLTLDDTDLHLQTSGDTHAPPAAQLSLQHDLLMDGRLQSSRRCSTGKIETWLQSCGDEASPECSGQITVESFLKTGCSFEDDLGLGAEATALHAGLHEEEFGHCPVLMPPPKSRKDFHTNNTSPQRLNLPLKNMGHSMTSSVFSCNTNKTASSVSEVLQFCAEDAEETLYQLGFGCEEPQVTARIPGRFFNFPSQLNGINFRLFLESQLRRIREEDPNLSLASRFRQVEVLTQMANAFYSLYSHVSRTPLQKLAPPQFNFSSPTVERSIGQRFFGTARIEPRSPVERLKDTVSKMCLYTSLRGSDSTSPNCSPRKRNSLPDVVDILVANTRSNANDAPNKETRFQEQTEALDITQTLEVEKGPLHSNEVIENPSDHEKISNAHKERIQRWSQSGQSLRACLLENASLESIHAQNPKNFRNLDETFTSPCSITANLDCLVDHKTSVAIISYDVFSPHVNEHVHHSHYNSPENNCVETDISSWTVQTDSKISCKRKLELEPKSVGSGTDAKPQIFPSPGDDCASLVVEHLHSQHDNVRTQVSPCQIMVTELEEDATIGHKDLLEDCSNFSNCTSTLPLHSTLPSNQMYLSPTKPPTNQNIFLKQTNSFEMEEVQSVGEEENTTEQHSASTLSVTASPHSKCLELRGDSFQSDSSGYVEEEQQNSPSPKEN